MGYAERAAAPLELVAAAPRPEHAVIAHLVNEGARVLDVGCGDGALLALLARTRRARGRGIERNQTFVNACVARGLTAVQGDPDHELAAFPDASFDYVVFAHTLQRLVRPQAALKQAARIGERVIVSLDNCAHWRTRLRLVSQGRLAPTHFDAGALHPCSVRDFAELAHASRLTVERAVPMSAGEPGAPFAKTLWRANWFAESAVFLLGQ